MLSKMFSRYAAGLTLAALGCAAATALAGTAEKLPADVLMVIDVDVAGFVKSELYKKHSEKLLANWPGAKEPGYVRFKESTGFNAETDIRSMSIGLAGEVFGGKPTVYAVADGNFDQAKWDNFAKGEEKLKVGSQDGLTTYTSTEPGDGGSPPPTFAIVDKSTMILAETANLGTLIGAVKGGANLKTSPKLGALISKAGAGQIRMAVVLPDQAKEQMKANPQMAPLASVQTVDFSLNATAGIDVVLEATADTADNGKLVYDTLNGLLAMGKMASGENPDLAKLMTNLKLEPNGAANKMSLSIPAEDVDKLMGMAMMGMGGGAPPASTEAGEEAAEEEGGDEGEAEAAATPAP